MNDLSDYIITKLQPKEDEIIICQPKEQKTYEEMKEAYEMLSRVCGDFKPVVLQPDWVIKTLPRAMVEKAFEKLIEEIRQTEMDRATVKQLMVNKELREKYDELEKLADNG